MSEIAEQFCSIKKYLKKLFLKNFVYIIDSFPKLKKKNWIANLQKYYTAMNKTQHCQEAIARQESTQNVVTRRYLGQQKKSKTRA